jgi:hypothetical protein
MNIPKCMARSSRCPTTSKSSSTCQETAPGKGKISWSSYPVELAEGLDPAVASYGYPSAALKIKPMFELQAPLPPSVLIYSTALGDALRYIMESQSADDTQIDLRDTITGAPFAMHLCAQRTAPGPNRKAQKSSARKGWILS